MFTANNRCLGNEPFTRKTINLAGKWGCALDSSDVGVRQKWFDSLFVAQINLPGTLDEAQIGYPNTLLPKLEKPQILHLTRKFSYIGPAWYTKEFIVGKECANQKLMLNFERILWTSDVWIDGVYFGRANSLIAPHRFIINSLSAGKHKIAVRIDNRKQFDISVSNMAHAYTNETQVMWNGIIGNMTIDRLSNVTINNIRVYPNIDKKEAKVVVDILNTTGKPVSGTIKLEAKLRNKAMKAEFHKLELTENQNSIELHYPIGDSMQLWNEFNPNVYSMNVELTAGRNSDASSTTFGMRKLSNKNGKLQINDNQIFLRGTLECCIFPQTGHPPMAKDEWRKLFTTAHQWGLNHIRFHSWCPPQAAFDVADEMGFYLQIELPIWSLTVGKDSATTHFIENEAQRISAEYGNHPSFCLWSMGNELEGDANVLMSLVSYLKQQDNRHLYTTTTFSFQKGLGTAPQVCDDYFVTQWTDNGWIRGQGVFNSESPSFNKNYSSALKDVHVPVISHEIGQYSIYPNINEIDKYKGTLIPLNFMAVKDDLAKKGLLSKADDFLYASGKLASILYKEEIERAMKTPEFSGFQLLDLHDFTGQGTALVGLLDAFWESKGIIAANEFNAFCNSVVPLVNYAKAIYLNTDTFKAVVGLANYTDKPLFDKYLTWSLSKNDGEEIAKGTISTDSLCIGYNTDLGIVEVPLLNQKKAQQLVFKLSVDGSMSQNVWNIWVYPSDLKIDTGAVVVTSDLNVAQMSLAKGQKVLYNPKWQDVKGIEGKFVPVFWSPVHFSKQAGTMGILCDPEHSALANFPTESYSNWQWWNLNINSTVINLDSFPTVTPIVEPIDNFVNNRHLATLFEAKVGNGYLVVSTMDVTSNLDKRPVAKQLQYSILKYMNSSSFKPVHAIKSEDLNRLITIKPIDNAKKKSEDIY
jgi:hypothetical protein